MRAVVVAVLLPALAYAESETVEQQLRDLAIRDDHARGFHVVAFSQLVTSSTRGNNATASDASVGVGGDLRYAAKRCDYIRLGGQARLAMRDDTQVALENWASACVPIFIMEVGHHLEWDVRPALLAPLGLRPGLNRRETVSFRWQPLRMKLGYLLASIEAGEAKKQGVKLTDPIDPENPDIPQGDGIVFDVRVNTEIVWTPSSTPTARESADVLGFGYERAHRAPWGDDRNFTVDVFRGGGEFIGNEMSTVGAWLVRIENLQLGPIYASAGGGIVSGSAGERVGMYEREVSITKPRLMFALETGGAAIHGHARFNRDLGLVADGYVTDDQRATIGIGIATASTRVDVEGALALTEVHVPGVMPVKRGTGGGSIALAYAITPHIDATLRVDVARSFYAANVTQLDFMPRLGAYVFGALQAHIGK